MRDLIARAGFGLYHALASAAAPLALHLLRRRVAQGKESPERLGERQGVAARPRPPGPLVWVHGASVGESLAALPLIRALLAEDPALHVLVTTGTVTSAALMGERLPARAFHQFVPVDSPPFVRRFLDWWRPDAALWLESEFWPNLILALEARGVPLVLVNGRMSEHSFGGWARARPLIRRLLGAFRECLAQDQLTAARLRELGAASVTVTGSLKTDAEKLPAEPEALAALTASFAGRPVWLAASTHTGEEEIAGAAHLEVRRQMADTLLVLVPRHPARGREIAAMLRGQGHTVAQRTAGESPGRDISVYLADTIGELGLFYRLAGAAFIGGSLVSHGGQNPYEPARLACPILHGPHVSSFAEAYAALAARDAAIKVAGAGDLAAAILRLLQTPAERATYAARAKAVLGEGGALANTLAAIGPILKRAQEQADARA